LPTVPFDIAAVQQVANGDDERRLATTGLVLRRILPMVTQEQVYGHWNELAGKIKERWGQVTDSDLNEVDGNFEQLVGLIQQKTGEARAEIESWLDQLSEQLPEVRGRVQGIRRRVRDRYVSTRHAIRQRPAQSVAVAFGAGLLIGVIVGLLPRSR
jgi:uncharacterized protein YjbJ (UPF0337 family)